MKKFFLRVSDKEQGLDTAARDLCAGHNRDDIIEQAVRVLERDPSDDSLGYGGFPNLLGTMELDAAFMDGDSRLCGAVAGVTNFLPVRIARRLMQQGFHTFLLGSGAEAFASDCGLTPEQTLSKEQREKWERDIQPLLNNRGAKALMDVVRQVGVAKERNLDTTVMIASDGKGLSGAASTSGWPYKHPGRVGDTPIVGAGLYVDTRHGGSCCTYTGEMAMRACTAHFVVAQMAQGKSPIAAIRAAIEDMSNLHDGLLRAIVIHAVDPDGNAHAAAINATNPIFYQYWHEDLPSPVRRKAETMRLSW
jgi:isoaspartyl peptidase/L-asparaginase-like protein (Ntn-hydrolase superfamily)